MVTFEQGFAEVERAADSVLRASLDQVKQARQLKKAAQEGNIAAIRRLSERVALGADTVRQAAANAVQAWPFPEESEREYLQESYLGELQAAAKAGGLSAFERDGRLIAHPSIVRVAAGDRAVAVNRKQSASIRPTRVVEGLQRLQKSPPRFSPQQFLESLHMVYGRLTRDRTIGDRLPINSPGLVVRLAEMYEVMTALPGYKRDYSQLDFARDLHRLETSGVTQTRSGERVSFPASTGTRALGGLISFIDADGQSIPYYGITFTGAQR